MLLPSWRGAVRERVHAPIASLFSRSTGSSWNPPTLAATPTAPILLLLPQLLEDDAHPETEDAVDETVATSSGQLLDVFRFLDRLELRSAENNK